MISKRITSALIVVVLSCAAHAQTVRFETNVGSFNLELNPTHEPLLQGNVDNLLQYVTSGQYDNTVINRADAGFVLQMGVFQSPGAKPSATISGFVPIVGFPPVSGVPVTGGSVRWPDAAGLASGKAYHSVLRIQGGNADVTVQGAGTASVSVPAGAYRASVVKTTITAQGQTVEVTVWIAQGTGPVKSEVLIRAPGGTGLTTYELLSFAKAVSAIGDGS